MAKPNTNEALSSELDFASSYKTERPLRRNGLIDSAFVTKNNRSLNFAALHKLRCKLRPRHSLCAGLFLSAVDRIVFESKRQETCALMGEKAKVCGADCCKSAT